MYMTTDNTQCGASIWHWATYRAVGWASGRAPGL